MNNSSSGSITALVPGGVVTTQNISTVIKPKENNNSMQFVKIQTPELSKKAVEQIKIAEESKISKDKIKEVEEEWQSNLLNWKSKRRQQFVGIHPESNEHDEQSNNKKENSRKIKTFAEMIEQRAKAGNRLNFHLQRYIGDDEHNNNDEHENNFNPKNSINNNDSDDGSANSSDAVESKHSSSHSVANDDQIDKEDEGHDEFDQALLSRIDNTSNGLGDIVGDDDNDREIEHEPINSTFKQGIGSPPAPPTVFSDVDIEPMLDVETSLVDRLHLSDSTKNDDNGSDYDEDDDEEEEQGEEQKQLQRIAFVAKLNAFERMTKPTTKEPKFVPTKTVKAPPPPPLPSKTQSFTNPKNQPVLQKNDVQLSQPPARANNVTNTTSILIQQRQPQQLKQSQPSQTLSSQSCSSSQQTKQIPQPIPQHIPQSMPQHIPQPSPQNITQPIPQQIPQPIPQHIPQPTPQHISQPNPHQTPQSIPRQNPQPIPTQILQKNSPPIPRQHVSSQQPPPPVRLHHSRPVPQQSPPQPIRHATVKPSPPEQRLSASPPRNLNQNQQQQQQQQHKIPHAEQSLPQPPPRQESRLQQNQQQHPPPQQQPQSQVQHQPQPQSHSQPKTSPQPQSKTQPQPQQSLKDKAQDRTVLSVSGKKRCSSCKEELGRGAAAFVIESLNLVYHTNCFRCSVCHVNLSNGFRGVDVRVHTGALHCQNCYSKDGLNYSRV